MATLATAPAQRARMSVWRRPETRWAYLFILPWIIGFVVFTAGPMVASLVLSFTDYDAIGTASWIGADNYQRMASDTRFRSALLNTLWFTVLHVPLHVAVSLGLALLLKNITGRLSGFFRTVFYLPAMTPTVAVGAVFLLLLNGQSGAINAFLGWFGIRGPAWTTDPSWMLYGVVILSLWTVGGSVIILFAGLNEVPKDLYEAARIDGAGPLRQFRSVTLPMISSSLFFVVIVSTIGALQLFNEVYTMYYGNAQTQLQASDAVLTLAIYVFQQGFQFLDMGYASAVAWVLFIVILLVTVINLKFGDKFVFYEGDQR